MLSLTTGINPFFLQLISRFLISRHNLAKNAARSLKNIKVLFVRPSVFCGINTELPAVCKQAIAQPFDLLAQVS